MLKRLKVIFTGTVQGVGFRAGVQGAARGFSVTGYVRNLPDGTVELAAEGQEAELRDFLHAVQDSHLAAYIRRADAEWNEGRGEFREFRITG